MEKTRWDSIDVLRGLAALWVVFYHFWKRFYPEFSTQTHWYQSPEDPTFWFYLTFALFQYGFVGVTLFFVLSGFCIHWPQARVFAQTGSDGFSIKSFVSRRFWRLYPAYAASIVLTALILGFFPILLALGKKQWPDFVQSLGLSDAILNALFLQQFRPSSFGFNGVYWTLLYEVQFYAFYPLLLFLVRCRSGFATVFVILLGLEVLLAIWPTPIPHFFLNRYFEWFLGMLLAESFAQKRTIPWTKATLVLGLTLGFAATLRPEIWIFRDLLFAIGFFGLLAWSVQTDFRPDSQTKSHRFFSRLFSWPPLLSLGAISYSLYLIHVPIIDWVWTTCQLSAKYAKLPTELAQAAALVSVPLAVLLARKWHSWFESPFLRTGQRQKTSKIEAPT